MKPYLSKCPHLKTVERERVEFFTDSHGVDRVRVLSRWNEFVPCGERRYEVVSHNVFTADDGYDPKGIKVKCRGCGQEYYLFPGLGERLPEENHAT